jgi:hypothetical protein
MRKIALMAAVALAVPTAALAAKPPHPATPANSHANKHATATSTTGTSSKANAKAQSAEVTFVLHGTLGAYTAASGATNGSIAITVRRANHGASALKNTTLTLPVSSATKVVGTITSGHSGTVKVRAAKNASAATLQTLTAFQIIG